MRTPLKTTLAVIASAIVLAALFSAPAVSQTIKGTLVNFGGVAQPVSGTFWQATQPVSGTVTASQSTAANLKAQVALLASISTSGTLQSSATANGNGTPLNVDGMASAVITLNCASCGGGTTVNFESSEDGSNFGSMTAIRQGTATFATSTTTAGVTIWQVRGIL